MNPLAAGPIAIPQPLLQPPPPASTPPARTSLNGHLVSLAVPVPGAVEGQELRSMLLTWMRDLPPPDQPPPMDLPLFAAAIWALDNDDTAPHPFLAHQCMDLLLGLGQTRLMVRLAEKCPIGYGFNVSTSHRCEILTKACASWPKVAPITLIVSNTLPEEVTPYVRDLLMSHDAFYLEILADEAPDPSALATLADALRPRHVPALFFSVGAHAVETFRALVGITADKIAIRTLPSANTSPTLWATLEPVAMELVARSEASQLGIAAVGIPSAFAAHLVLVRLKWDEVQIPFSAELTELLLDEHRIHRLELTMGPYMLEAAPAFMQMLSRAQVRELVVDGMLDLTGFAQSLELPSSDGVTLSLLQGAFLYKDGGSFFNTMTELARDVRVEKTVHHPMPLPPPAGYTMLPQAHAEALNAQNVTNQMALLRRVHGDASTKSAAWGTAVKAISEVLAPNQPVRALITYLKSVQNTFVDLQDLSWMPPLASNSVVLADKLKALEACGFPHGLIRDAIAHRLRSSPAEAHAMCRAMIVTRFPTKPGDWVGLGRQHQKQWAVTNSDIQFNDRVLSHAPEMPATPAKTTITTTTATTTTTTTSTTPSPSIATTTDVSGTRAVPTTRTQTPQAEALAVKNRLAEELTEENEGENLPLFIASIAQPYADPLRSQVIRALQALFYDGKVSPDLQLFSTYEAIGMGLLRANDLSMLRTMAIWMPQVILRPSGVVEMESLKRLTDVPYRGGKYVLDIDSTASDADQKILFNFAKSVPAAQLKLRFVGSADTEIRVWRQWADFLRSHPGAHLQLVQPSKFPLSRMHEILKAVPPDTLRGFGLSNGLLKVDARFVDALDKFVTRSGAQETYVGADVHPDAAGKLLSRKEPWKEMGIDLTEAHNVHFKARTVSTRVLRVWSSNTSIEDVFACRGLETLEISHTMGFPFLAIATKLREFPAIRFVKCALTFNDEPDFQKGLNLLMLRPPLNLEITNQIDPVIARRIHEATQRRRLFDPEVANAGAGKGWGYGLGPLVGKPVGSGELIDIGGQLGRMLDPESAKILAQTNRAAYLSWKQAWMVEVGRIAAWLSPEVSYQAFEEILLDRVDGQSPINGLAGPVVETYPERRTLSKAIALHQAGMPTDVIAMAIGLQLNEHASHTKEFLEALAYLGVIKGEVWFKEAYALDVSASSVQPG